MTYRSLIASRGVRNAAKERPPSAPRSRVKGDPFLTWREAEVLANVSLGLDPWNGFANSSRSRVVSQAMARLKRKGFIEYAYRPGELDMATDRGLAELRRSFECAMRIHYRPWELLP